MSKSGGSTPLLNIKLYLIPLLVQIWDSKSSFDQLSFEQWECSASAENTCAPFICEDMSVASELCHDKWVSSPLYFIYLNYFNTSSLPSIFVAYSIFLWEWDISPKVWRSVMFCISWLLINFFVLLHEDAKILVLMIADCMPLNSFYESSSLESM